MRFPPVLTRAAAAASLALVATIAVAGPAAAEPPPTYGGRQLSIVEAMEAGYDGGFRSEEQLLTVTSIAIAESSLYSGLRNWHPELGGGAADRGLFQINSFYWPQYSDATVDDPAQAARVTYEISSGGTDFVPWHTFTSGEAQKHFDSAYNGWPAVRPHVQYFLAARNGAPAPAPPTAVTAASAAPSGEVSQVLGKGGTLYKMAIQHYGNGEAWRYIAVRNGVLVPEQLLAEQVLIIP